MAGLFDVFRSPNCPDCEQGFLERIETKTDNDRYVLFRCIECNNFVVKEYKVIDMHIFRNDEYYLTKDNELKKRQKPIINIRAEEQDYILAARKGLFSLRDFWISD